MRSVKYFFFVFYIVSCEKVCENDFSFYKTSGNVLVTGVFNAHSGENCSEVNSWPQQIIRSVISSVNFVREIIPIQGVEIGLSLYDTCSSDEMALKTVVSALVEAECKRSFVLVGLMEKNSAEAASNLTQSVGLQVITVQNISHKLLATTTAQVLKEMNWSPIHYIVADHEVQLSFIKEITKFNMCIYHVIPIEEIDEIEQGGTIVIVAESHVLKKSVKNWEDSRVLMVPIDGVYDQGQELNSLKHLVLLPPQLKATNGSELTGLRNLHTLQIARDLVEMTKAFEAHLETHCGAQTLCPNLPKMDTNVIASPIEDLNETASILKSLLGDGDGFESFTVIEGTKRIGGLKMMKGSWIWELDINSTETLVCKTTPDNETTGFDCRSCSNFRLLYEEYFNELKSSSWILQLREEAWVAAALSMSTVGTLCCLAIIVFIVVRICKKDLLEGNPSFSFLLLLSIILMYCSVLPFSVKVYEEYERLLWCCKTFGTSFSYSLVFSVMLARSLMLASCDDDGGFMSHINGYIQTILCFFIISVQAALILPFFVMNELFSPKNDSSARRLFLYLMSYDVFLLFLLVCTAPVIVRSKRNYSEGWYFSLATVLIVSVWAAWLSGYVLIPGSDELFICSGLVATATSALVAIFIPRTYLMVTGIVRDHLVSTLPSLSRAASNSIVDMNYRSTQALYDSVSIRGQHNPNYYAEAPTALASPKLGADSVNGDYERYGTGPSLTVTRF